MNVQANMIVLMSCLIILIYCVQTDNRLDVFILCVAPIELLNAYVKIRQILKRTDLPTPKQKLFRILTSSQILDAIALCLSSIIFFIVKYVSAFKYTFCVGPMVLSTTIILIKNICTKREVKFVL